MLKRGGADTGIRSEPARKICESTRSTESLQSFGLAKSREKRVQKIKNMYGVAYKPTHKSRNQHKFGNDPTPKSPIRSRWVNFLFFQIFVCLTALMISTDVSAVSSVTLSVVDTKGDDTVFNGSTENLRITISLSDDPSDLGTYTYILKVDGHDEVQIGSPGTIEENETKTIVAAWDGGSLSEGTYTIRVEIREPGVGTDAPATSSDEATVTLDRTDPEISIGTDLTEFSPNGDRFLDAVTVYYSVDEDVIESELEFFRVVNDNETQFGRPERLEETAGEHTFFWDGADRNFRIFPDGQYKLRIKVVDKGGNSAESDKTNPITIDTQAPVISRVVANESLTIVNGVFINVPIQSIKMTADDLGGTPIDFTDLDTALMVEAQDDATIKGSLSQEGQSLTLSFGNRLDTASENGEYTISIAVADRAGNLAEKTLNFTFDNIAPNLTAVATSNGKLTPGSGVSTRTNFVEATLSDNIKNGLSLSDSTIRLTGPNGTVLGQQTQPTANKIRWLFLLPLLARDGLMDGTYTIEIDAVDKAGNRTGALQIPFIFDNLPPLVTLGSAEESPFTLNQDTIYHAQPLSQIVATFDDAGIGVDLDGDTRVTFGTRDAGGGLNTLPGRVILAKDRDQLAYVLETPLTSRDGSQDGRYVLNVQATDTLGNTETYRYQLVYDTQLPALVSTAPAANETVSELSQVEIVLDEATSGIDFIQSTFRLTRTVDGDAVDVPVNLTSNGTDAATLTLAKPIALDGSDDGTYIIEISPTDLAGNVGVTVRREFYLVSQSQPEIRLTMPETTTVNNLTTVVAELSGYIGAGIDPNASTLTVRNAQGGLITSTELQHNEVNNLLTWNIEAPLPRDGSADGEYTVTATFVDFIGQRLTQQFQLLLDTQFPAIESVQAATDSKPELATGSTTIVAEGFSQIIVTFENAQEDFVSGIDFANTGVTFTNPSGESISVNRLDDGANVLTLDFPALTQRGEYVLSVTPQDLAGNQSAAPLVYRLRVDVPLPTVTSVLIGDKLGTIVYLNGEATNIVATFADLSGAGLDLDDGGSTIAVTTESGLPAPGITTSNGTDQLTWTPTVLPTDGSADGRYTVTITPKDKAGRQGDVIYRQFVYDTQEPRITAATPVSLIQPVTYINGSLTQLQFTVEDVGPAGLALDEQTIELLDAQGASVSATLTFDELNSQLYLTLDAPLAQDGSADGEYTVKLPLVDRSGNVLDSEHVLVYDSQVPRISSVSVNTESPLELFPQEVVEVPESISSITLQFEDAMGIDFTNTGVTLTNPAGENIAVNRSDDGGNVLTLDFQVLTQRGEYILAITPQDLAGNQSAAPFVYRFRVGVPLPTVTSVLIGNKLGTIVYVNGDATNIVATFADLSGAGLDLDDGGSTIAVTTESGLPAPGITTSNGTNQLTWTPTVLPIDGSADGRYTVVVTPKDKAGRQGDAVYRQFVYDTQEPRITAATPISLTQPVTYIGGSLTQFQFTVEDLGPAGLELSEQTIELLDAQGASVDAIFTFDEINSQLYLTLDAPLAQDGSADGEYVVKVSLVDKSGNMLESAQSFVYDSQVPRVSSVLINTETPVELVPQQITEIAESISSVTLQFEEATRVDFANTVVSLVGPDEQPIPINVAADGLTQLTARFVALTQAGLYTLSVTPQDIAGNVAQGAVQYAFRLDFVLPSVSIVELGGQIGDVVFLNGSDTTIVATLLDGTGTGLALADGGSSIVVTGPSGTIVPGQTHTDGENQLTWQPISLPTDGSADGRYTVAVTPVDKAGRQGDVVYRQFIYDTENPRITASSPIVLSQPVSYISGGLNQFSFTVEDVGPADLLLEAQTIELIDSSGNVVPATLTSDELTNQLYLTLSLPFARDGSVDGPYTVRLSLIDRAGNTLDSEHLLIYDSQVPQLSSVMVNTEPPIELVPQGTTEVLEPISSITIQFDEVTRVDFVNTAVTLVRSGVSATSEVVDIPLTLQDDGTSQITASFLELNQLATYVLSVTPRDIAGNVAPAPINYTFILDIPLPSVSSVVIGDSETVTGGDVVYVNASNIIIGAVLEDPTGTGLSFGSDGSDITVADTEDLVVPGQIGSNGVDLLVWEPITLTTDGTTDGRYSVYVTPVDKAGREGNTVYREFIYDTQEPEITAADPIDLSQPVSYISQSLTQFHFTVADVGPADLELSDQKVSLRDANGNLVPAQLTNDTNNQLFFTLDQPLPLDGSMDGEYTIVIELADKAGNAFTVEHSIVYDTQAPTLVSTVPADGSLLTEDVTQIQVTLNDEGGSGIDWTTTTITLVNPSGLQISGEIVSNGTTTLTLSTNQLVEDGRYTIRVQAVDRAGNGEATRFERNFLLSRRLPTIVSTEPLTAPVDEAFTNEEIERIEVELETDDENHLSTLRLLNPGDQVVAGQQQRASGKLIYNLVRPLATDGSEDGRYTIEFTPISASGRNGETQRLTFMYDTQAPEIESDDVIDLVVAQPGVNNSLTEIRVNLTDDTSGIDWENLDEKWLTFERLAPNASKISGRVDDDGQGNLTFRLTVPLADNGSADGEYRIIVNPKDRAGNDDEPYERVFIYDTSPPMIDAGTLLINDAPLLVDINTDNYPTAVSTTGGVVIQANIFDTGLGVNLAQSKITVRRPDGSELSGNTQQNGVDTIVFKSDGLTLRGNYQVEVTSIGNDSELLGFAPTDSITTEFLYETGEPTATVTSDGGETELTDEPLPLEGTATDPAGTQRIGDGEIPVQASGVWLVEIVGTGPDDQPIAPVPAVDDSNAQEEPWSRWSIDFLPTRSGEYDLDVRVTDNAGNYAVYDIGKYTMSVSLTFRGSTFGWPNPLRLSQRDVAFFSFDVNVPLGETIELTLSIYDWSGDMVLSQTYPDVVSGQRNDQLVKWNLENQSGNTVARGLYIFRLEAVNAAGNSANVVGKVLVVD